MKSRNPCSSIAEMQKSLARAPDDDLAASSDYRRSLAARESAEPIEGIKDGIEMLEDLLTRTTSTLADGEVALLCNHAAGDSISRITGRISNIVVSGGMDNDGAALGVKDRSLPGTERDTFYERFIASDAIFVDDHVRQITGVRTVGIFKTVLFVPRIEMTSGARKVGPFTLANRVDVHGMEPLRKPFDTDADQHSITALGEHSAGDVFPRAVLEVSARLNLGAGIRHA